MLEGDLAANQCTNLLATSRVSLIYRDDDGNEANIYGTEYTQTNNPRGRAFLSSGVSAFLVWRVCVPRFPPGRNKYTSRVNQRKTVRTKSSYYVPGLPAA